MSAARPDLHLARSRPMAIATDLDQLAINTIRTLSIDAVQKANSGHPGLPLGAAPMAYVLWTRFLRHNPRNPHWPDRDRFAFSAGHGSMLLYSLLHLTGYDLPLDEIKQFRQWGSKTPGHPEYRLTPGVELTTGPLGQGFANGIGLAMAEAHLAATYNRPGHTIVDHRTFGLVSDGDLMEGVAYESSSLAGHLRLGKLVYLYDANQVTLAGSMGMVFSEDVGRRFEAQQWHVQHVDDGNDLQALQAAIQAGVDETNKPSLIIVHTTLGFGSPNKAGTFEAHGNPLGPAEVEATKHNLHWPSTEPFYIPPEALSHFRQAVERGQQREGEWQRRFDAYAKAFPDLAAHFRRSQSVARVGRRQRRSEPIDQHRAQRRRRPGEPRQSGPGPPGRHRRRMGLRRPQHLLRRARARHGRDHQRPDLSRRPARVQRNVPGLQRLHAPADAPGRAERAALDLRVHPRLDRPRRRRPDPSARRAPARAARHPEHGRLSTGRCERGHRRLACRHRTESRPHDAGVQPPGPADLRSHSPGRRFRRSPWRVRPRRRGRSSRCDPHWHGLRGGPGHACPRSAVRGQSTSGEHAVMGALRTAAAKLSR